MELTDSPIIDLEKGFDLFTLALRANFSNSSCKPIRTAGRDRVPAMTGT